MSIMILISILSIRYNLFAMVGTGVALSDEPKAKKTLNKGGFSHV